MVEYINRFLEHPDNATRNHIVELFGTPMVLKISQTSGNRVTKLRILYQEQLKTCAKFVRFFEMRDDRGKPIYYLFFATNHRLGHVKMKEAFWKVDPSSGITFSDSTDPNQLVLFDIDQTFGLSKDLMNKFGSSIQITSNVRMYVEDETPFTVSQMKNALNQLEEDGKITVEQLKLDSTKRKKNTYPDTSIIRFS